MLERFLISKKEISRFKVAQKNPFELTCEKVTQKPRVFNTSQIKNAIDNILFTDFTDDKISPLIIGTVEYILKDLFLSMHQTGLYNRQLKLWKTIGSVTYCSISKLQKGLLKKIELNVYVINFYIDPQNPCFTGILQEENDDSFNLTKDLKTYLPIISGKPDRVKGIFYFLNKTPNNEFFTKLDQMTNAFDAISKYESKIMDSKDIRLNVINFTNEDKKYNFQHIYPEVKTMKPQEVKL